MDATQFKGKGVLKWALSIGIIIILNLFFAVAIQTVTPEPKFEDFCVQQQVRPVLDSEESCVAVGGQWNPPYTDVKPVDLSEPKGYCNEFFTCQMEYEDERKAYSQNVFVALVVLGALSIGLGFVLRMSPAVSAGLSYGGVLSFIIASVRYWEAAGDYIRLGIVGLALIVLVYIGVKKFKE
ncbi:MAG: hypothetical protein AAB439_03645 [Patescibacteria group bacterium]